MTRSSTAIATRPVAACMSSGEMPRREPTSIQTAANQVTTDTATPTPPRARSASAGSGCAPSGLATIAISTRIDSSPSRKTRSPLLNDAAPPGSGGSRSGRRRRRPAPARRDDAEQAGERDEEPTMAGGECHAMRGPVQVLGRPNLGALSCARKAITRASQAASGSPERNASSAPSLRAISLTTSIVAVTTRGSNCEPAQRSQLGHRLRERPRLAVRAVGGHRVERVAHETMRASSGIVLAGQAVGVAVAVPALVARRGRSHRRRAGRPPTRCSSCCPSMVWVSITARSSGVSWPGLLMISSGMRILPTSCSSAASSPGGGSRRRPRARRRHRATARRRSRLCEPV